jgi:hypothetical protein
MKTKLLFLGLLAITGFAIAANASDKPVVYGLPVTITSPAPTPTPVVYSTPASYIASGSVASHGLAPAPLPIAPVTTVNQPTAPSGGAIYHFVAPPTPIPTPCGAGYAFGVGLCQQP